MYGPLHWIDGKLSGDQDGSFETRLQRNTSKHEIRAIAAVCALGTVMFGGLGCDIGQSAVRSEVSVIKDTSVDSVDVALTTGFNTAQGGVAGLLGWSSVEMAGLGILTMRRDRELTEETE